MGPKSECRFKALGRGCIQIAVLTFLMTSFQMIAWEPGADANDRSPKRRSYGPSPCALTSKAAFKACDDAAKEAYWLAIGKCDNLSEQEDKEECVQEAKEDIKSEFGLCKEQYDARNDVCELLGGEAYDPVIDPDNFRDLRSEPEIDNEYLPLKPGTTYIYKSEDEKIVVKVTDEITEILGVTCRVVRDTAKDRESGQVLEDTIDWYAQDNDGNVWYFGEVSKQYDEEGNLVSLEGSWKAGVDGARPGIIMFGDPAVQAGAAYRQEFLLGEAEDLAQATGDGAEVDVKAGAYKNCLETEEFTPLEPEVRETKFYAPGVGLVLTTDAEGAYEELVKIKSP